MNTSKLNLLRMVSLSALLCFLSCEKPSETDNLLSHKENITIEHISQGLLDSNEGSYETFAACENLSTSAIEYLPGSCSSIAATAFCRPNSAYCYIANNMNYFCAPSVSANCQYVDYSFRLRAPLVQDGQLNKWYIHENNTGAIWSKRRIGRDGEEVEISVRVYTSLATYGTYPDGSENKPADGTTLTIRVQSFCDDVAANNSEFITIKMACS